MINCIMFAGRQPNSDIMQCHPHADNRNDGKDWGILCFDAGADHWRDVSSNVWYYCRCWYIQSSGIFVII